MDSEGLLWTAVVEAARVLGLERMLPRLVASRLPREPFLQILSTSIEPERVKVLALHRCPHGCTLEPGQCLTSLLVEVEVQRVVGRPLEVVETVAMPEGQILLSLEPLDKAWHSARYGDTVAVR